MTDLAKLKIEVDASDIDNATQALERLTKAAGEAKEAMDRLNGRSNGTDLGLAIQSAVMAEIGRQQRPGGLLSTPEPPARSLPERVEAALGRQARMCLFPDEAARTGCGGSAQSASSPGEADPLGSS